MLTERALRDAWARWTELRPEDLDWSVGVELAMRRRDVCVPIVGRSGGWPREHVAMVRILEAVPGAPSLPRREVFACEVEPEEVLRVVDALAEMFMDEPLMAWVRERLPGWREALECSVWRRLRSRSA